MMQGVRVHEHGDTSRLVIEDLPVPAPGPGEVLIAVAACGLNHLDLWVRRGVSGHHFPLPLVPGSDVAGTVADVGPGVTAVRTGERVMVAPGLGCLKCIACLSGRDHMCRHYGVLGETRDGGCAPFVVVPTPNAIPLPGRLSFEEGACLGIAFLTAWHMLVSRAELRPGETVLIHAGGSGVSVAAIQIARLWGARVLATVGHADKAEKARALGAHEALLYREVDFAEEVRRLTDRRGVDVVIDHVGQDTFERSILCLARGGRLVTCGATSGPHATIDLRHVFFKSLSLLGSSMGSLWEMHEIMRLVGSGQLRPVLDRTFPLGEIAEAHRYLEERRAFGKVVVLPRS